VENGGHDPLWRRAGQIPGGPRFMNDRHIVRDARHYRRTASPGLSWIVHRLLPLDEILDKMTHERESQRKFRFIAASNMALSMANDEGPKGGEE
jgi:hypothetical protein